MFVYSGVSIFEEVGIKEQLGSYHNAFAMILIMQNLGFKRRWLLALQEPKHVQPQLFRQPRQAYRLFGSDSSQHRSPDRHDACVAHDTVAML